MCLSGFTIRENVGTYEVCMTPMKNFENLSLKHPPIGLMTESLGINNHGKVSMYWMPRSICFAYYMLTITKLI